MTVENESERARLRAELETIESRREEIQKLLDGKPQGRTVTLAEQQSWDAATSTEFFKNPLNKVAP